ncbi:MAG: hypothetical protein WBK48_08395 [Dethiobacteria bacterium]
MKLLNIPDRRLDRFFSIREWAAIVAAKFLDMPEVASQTLTDYINIHQERDQGTGLSEADLDKLLERKIRGELTAEQFVQEIQMLRKIRGRERKESSTSAIVQALVQRTGVAWPVWENTGQEMLEAVMPMEIGNSREARPGSSAVQLARQMGILTPVLVSDYPMITATYGYSRADYRPNQCQLNPFPPHPDYNGKYPIFVDQIQADALLIRLDPNRVLTWLERNGCRPLLPNGTDLELACKAYFVELFNDVSLRETIYADRREARMVFGLLHTLCHLSIRQTALLCGLDLTSLSEYLLPRTLTFAIYCNHRFGATIGALTALFEQSLAEWLHAIKETRRCVYDPLCRDKSGNCHACTHLSETSCRFYNLNLSRAFLFGGNDTEIGNISIGYFDQSL